MRSQIARIARTERSTTIPRAMMESGGSWDASHGVARPMMGARDFGNTALLNVPDTMGGPDAVLPSVMGSTDPAGLPAIMGPRGGASDIMSDRPFPYASVAPLRPRVTPLHAPVLE